MTTLTRKDAIKYFLKTGTLTEDSFMSKDGVNYVLEKNKTPNELDMMMSRREIKDYLTQDHVILGISELKSLDRLAGEIEVFLAENY